MTGTRKTKTKRQRNHTRIRSTTTIPAAGNDSVIIAQPVGGSKTPGIKEPALAAVVDGRPVWVAPYSAGLKPRFSHELFATFATPDFTEQDWAELEQQLKHPLSHEPRLLIQRATIDLIATLAFEHLLADLNDFKLQLDRALDHLNEFFYICTPTLPAPRAQSEQSGSPSEIGGLVQLAMAEYESNRSPNEALSAKFALAIYIQQNLPDAQQITDNLLETIQPILRFLHRTLKEVTAEAAKLRRPPEDKLDQYLGHLMTAAISSGARVKLPSNDIRSNDPDDYEPPKSLTPAFQFIRKALEIARRAGESAINTSPLTDENKAAAKQAWAHHIDKTDGQLLRHLRPDKPKAAR